MTDDNLLACPESGDFMLPSIKTPGRVLVYVAEVRSHRLESVYVYRYEMEVLDYDGDAAPFWINEGVGWEYWMDDVEFPSSGVYVIENVRGSWIRGDGYTTYDDEEWFYDEPRLATDAEVAMECLS